MPQTERTIHSPELTPRPGETWIHGHNDDPGWDCEVEIVEIFGVFGLSNSVAYDTKTRCPNSTSDRVGFRSLDQRSNFRPKPGEPYCTPSPIEDVILSANLDGCYPLCRPGAPCSSAVKSCEVCGEPIRAGVYPCPAIPREMRWGPDAVATPAAPEAAPSVAPALARSSGRGIDELLSIGVLRKDGASYQFNPEWLPESRLSVIDILMGAAMLASIALGVAGFLRLARDKPAPALVEPLHHGPPEPPWTDGGDIPPPVRIPAKHGRAS